MNITLAAKHAALEADHAQQLRRFALEADPATPVRAGATAGGDERRLRGIPALARGVGGAINGTRPEQVRE